MTQVRVQMLPNAVAMPAYATDGAAGFDLHAAIGEGEPVTLLPGHAKLIPSGLKVELPMGLEMQIRPRSGLALKHTVTLVNSPGTIDCDYRGEVGIIVINHGKLPFIINRGDRIAQAVIAHYVKAELVNAQGLSETARGEGGFGSTGVKS
jgi:dUTP pyrophosphatase